MLSQDACSFSFAKFLELRLQTYTKSKKECSTEDTTNGAEVAPFTSFQYFLYKYDSKVSVL